MRAVVTGVVLLAIGGLAWFLLQPGPTKDVTLYCSVDQDQSQVFAQEFEKASGLKVNYQGETEAARSVGITRALEMEKDAPRADVLWANEIMNTVRLRDMGILAPLPAGVAEQFPPAWRDPKGTYVAFGARARILLVNRDLMPDRKDDPKGLDDLLDARWNAKTGRGGAFSFPLTGTSYTHAVALLVRDEAKGRDFWTRLAARHDAGEVKGVNGNGAVMQLVKDGKVAWGLTDTDDANEALLQGAHVEVVFPDQAAGQPGTLVIPNTAALVKGAPHPEAAKRLLEWLVSKDVEGRLAHGKSAQMPVREDVPVPAHVKRPGKDFRVAEVDWQQVGARRDDFAPFLKGLFAK